MNIKIHTRENNSESQFSLLEQHPHFTEKCLLLLRRLCEGERLRFNSSVWDIGDLRRRSLDLIENGIPVERTFIPGMRIKEYWIAPKNIIYVREKFRDLL